MGQKYNPSIPFQGLKFLFDFANTRSYPGSGTSLFNLVGPDHLIIDGGPGYAAVGYSSYAYCNGSGLFYNSNLSNTLPLQGPLTISIVYNPIAMSGVRQNYFALGNSTATSQLQYGIPSTISPTPSIFKGGGTPSVIASHTFAGLSTVIHMTYTVDGSNNSKIYINGILSSTSTTALATGTASQLMFNCNAGFSDAADAAYYWMGIWDRELNDKEVYESWNAFKRRWGFEAGTAGTTAGTPSPLAYGTEAVNLNYTYATQSFTNTVDTTIRYSNNDLTATEFYISNYGISYGNVAGSASTLFLPFTANESMTLDTIAINVYQQNNGLSEPIAFFVSEDSGNFSPIRTNVRGYSRNKVPVAGNTFNFLRPSMGGIAITANKLYWLGVSSVGSTGSVTGQIVAGSTQKNHYIYGWDTVGLNHSAGTALTGTWGPSYGFFLINSSGKIYGKRQTPVGAGSAYVVNSTAEVGISLYMPANHPSVRLSRFSIPLIYVGTGTTFYVNIRDNTGNLLSTNPFDRKTYVTNNGLGALQFSTFATIDLQTPYYLHGNNYYFIGIAGDGVTCPISYKSSAGVGQTDLYNISGLGITWIPASYTSGNGIVNDGSYTTMFSMTFDKIGYENTSGLQVMQ